MTMVIEEGDNMVQPDIIDTKSETDSEGFAGFLSFLSSPVGTPPLATATVDNTMSSIENQRRTSSSIKSKLSLHEHDVQDEMKEKKKNKRISRITMSGVSKIIPKLKEDSEEILPYPIEHKRVSNLRFQNYLQEKTFKEEVSSINSVPRKINRSPLSLRNLQVSIDDNDANKDDEIASWIADHLKTNFLFVSLNDETIQDIAEKFEIAEYEAGVSIIEQGCSDSSTYYYILYDGECIVTKNDKQVIGKFGTIDKGTTFGELAILFDDVDRSASIITKAPSVVYRLPRSAYRSHFLPDELEKIRTSITKIQACVNVFSGADRKINKGTIIRPYKPSVRWLVRQWSGTILQFVWKDVILIMLLTALFGIIVSASTDDWTPDAENDLILQLDLIYGWWQLTLGLTSFVTTFFLGASFSFWRNFYNETRIIQGRFNDVSSITASTAADTNEGQQALADIARLISLLHLMAWGSLLERFSCILTPEGISYLLSKKLITSSEYSSLNKVLDRGLGAWQATYTWLLGRLSLAVKRGEITADISAMNVVYEKMTNFRGSIAGLGDLYDGRMPLAYVHFVNMLVSVTLVVSPFALFPQYWFWSIIAVGVLCLFYRGIFVLSMMFLDPADNDKRHTTGMSKDQTAGFDVSVLITESYNNTLRYNEASFIMPKY